MRRGRRAPIRRGLFRRGPIRRRPIRPTPVLPRCRIRRIIHRRTMRLWLGTTAVILLVGGTAAAIKLRQEDVRRIEQETGKSADDLTEEELLAAMEKLGIRRLELTDDDAYLVEMTEKQGVLPANCGGCGAPLNPNEVRWHNTHTAECPYCGTMVKTTS